MNHTLCIVLIIRFFLFLLFFLLFFVSAFVFTAVFVFVFFTLLFGLFIFNLFEFGISCDFKRLVQFEHQILDQQLGFGLPECIVHLFVLCFADFGVEFDVLLFNLFEPFHLGIQLSVREYTPVHCHIYVVVEKRIAFSLQFQNVWQTAGSPQVLQILYLVTLLVQPQVHLKVGQVDQCRIGVIQVQHFQNIMNFIAQPKYDANVFYP